MKEIIDLYNQMSSGIDKSLEERTLDEIAYDEVVINELKKGRNIKKALKMANKKYPNEALQYDKELSQNNLRFFMKGFSRLYYIIPFSGMISDHQRTASYFVTDTKDSIKDIASHYDYLLNHESIKNKMKQVSQ